MSGRRIGNYLIVDYLGGGGFGSVFKAEDTSTPGRVVAIKELHKKHTRSAVIKQRFFQEAIAMAKLDHANLPKLYTFGEDNGSYYLVMEFLSGRSLTDQIHEKGQLQTQQALAITAQVLDAVSYAHRNGIIHRDLKPDNIMLYGDLLSPKVKVLDFGIARMIGGENLTMAGEGFGTPTYMSPERIAGNNEPDSRADIYSLGIILYEMLAGRPPFQSSSTDPVIYWSEMRKMHESSELPALGALGVPAAIERIIRKATAKTKAERYATADDMLSDVREALGSETAPLASAGARASQLFVTTVPAAAEVYVDGVLRGASDGATGQMVIDAVAPGAHTVRVVKSGYNEYSIGVVLEEGRRTDLQAPLAARSTVIMPQAPEGTSPFNATTVRMESGDEVATAMLMLEGVPAGSQVFVGSKAMALAGEDGKATLRLEPGVHELQVTTPSGAVGKQVVTLTQQDTRSLKTVAMPVVPDTGATPANVTRVSPAQCEPPPAKKRLAAAAAAILLLALAASAYFVLRKPAPAPVQNLAAATDTNPNPNSQAPAAEPAGEPVSASDTTEAERAAIDRERKELERERQELEKKKQAIKDAAATDKGQKGSSPVATPPPPATPTPPNQAAPATQPSAGTSCVGVRVIGPDGQPVPRAKVMFISSGVETRRTGPEGKAGVCGLPVGTTVSVMAFGAEGIPVSRKVTVSAGGTGVEIKLDRLKQPMPGIKRQGVAPSSDDGDPEIRRRRRPMTGRQPIKN